MKREKGNVNMADLYRAYFKVLKKFLFLVFLKKMAWRERKKKERTASL